MVQEGRSFVSSSPARLAAVIAACRQLIDVEDHRRLLGSAAYNRVCPATPIVEPPGPALFGLFCFLHVDSLLSLHLVVFGCPLYSGSDFDENLHMFFRGLEPQ